ncbi:MAG: hypothetical protein H7Y62_07140 [Hyphomicrobium sp.]|nr:hypothetical protein [Hyphomicrobium sp.]
MPADSGDPRGTAAFDARLDALAGWCQHALERVHADRTCLQALFDAGWPMPIWSMPSS